MRIKYPCRCASSTPFDAHLHPLLMRIKVSVGAHLDGAAACSQAWEERKGGVAVEVCGCSFSSFP